MFPVKHLFIGRLLLAALLGLALPVSPVSAESLRHITESGRLRVGMAVFQPWVMPAATGDHIGFEVDVARALADDLGVALEIVPTAWEAIIPALLDGRFDVIVSGLSITPERSRRIDFSLPYAHSGLELAANRVLAGGMDSLADFNRAEVVIAVRRGAAALAGVAEYLPQATVRFCEPEAACIEAVRSGRAHAWAGAAPGPTFAALDHPAALVAPLELPFARSDEAIGVRPGANTLLETLNRWIRDRKASGWLRTRHDYWFKGRDWADRLDR